MLEGIIDYRMSDEEISKDNMYVVTKRGQKHLRKTTIGWELLIK